MEESFAGYLFLLRKKYGVAEEGLWCRIGVPRELWERWASAYAFPSWEQFDRMLEGLPLKPYEERRLRENLEAKIGVRNFRSYAGLESYLRESPETLGVALARIRSILEWSAFEVSARVGCSPEEWELWEQGQLLPFPSFLRGCLKEILWLWRHMYLFVDESELCSDSQDEDDILWGALEHELTGGDPFAEDTMDFADEAPEVLEALVALEERTFGTSDPAEVRKRSPNNRPLCSQRSPW